MFQTFDVPPVDPLLGLLSAYRLDASPDELM